MTNLSDQVAALEADRDALKVQCTAQERQIAKQTGALLENRAQNAKLTLTIQRQAALISTYENHFRSFHHSASSVAAQAANAREITEAKAEPHRIIDAAPRIGSLAAKIAKVQANGNAGDPNQGC